MKFPLFQKDMNGKSEGDHSEAQSIERLIARMEAASQAADLAVKKAEMTARKAEAAATKAEVLVKQVQLMLDQVAQSAENGKAPTQPAHVEPSKDITYSETVPQNDRTVSDSGIPLVAPFIMKREGLEG